MKAQKLPVLLVISGPTGSGKTALAIQLAKHFGTHILSADSRQFYKEISIGTAKPTAEEQQAAPHHFIDSLSIHDIYTAGDYERDALALLNQLFQQHHIVILCGGSGLFVKAVCEGLDDLPKSDERIRNELIALHQKEGIIPLQEKLISLDPQYAAVVDLNNPNRVMRALEVCLSTGKPYSEFLGKQAAPRPFRVVNIGIDISREELYSRINLRVDKMLEQGLEDEARSVYTFRQLSCLNTVGYQEFFDHFDGLMTREQAIEKIKQHSRNYAKKQMTWFRKSTDIQWFRSQDMDKIVAHVTEQSNIFAPDNL